MAGETTSATLAADAVPVYIAGKLLDLAQKQVVFEDLAEEIPFPEGNGKTIQGTRYERIPLPTAPLAEGVTPNSTPLTTAIIQAVLDQWGVVVTLTDVAQLTIRHPTLVIAVDRLGTNWGELRDREAQRPLMGGTNVTFAGTAASRAALAAGDVVNADLLRKITAILRTQGARGIQGRRFVGVCDPFVSQDIQKDPTFTSSAGYSNITALHEAEIGMWIGSVWRESNLIPILSRMAGADFTVATAAAAGAETGFASGTTVPVVITRLDPDTGFETVISVQTGATTGSIFTVDVTVASGAVSAIYNVYVGLENATVATLQTQVTHVTGVADVRSYIKAGTPNDATTFVVQGTGPVAPTAPPATGNVHISYVLGKGALGRTRIGARMEPSLTPQQKSDSDPLGQRRKAGYKDFFKFLVLNSKFYQRLESMSAFN